LCADAALGGIRPHLALGIDMQQKPAILCCALALAVLWLQPAAAQQPPRQHPADPAVTVPPARYTSAFAGYQPLGDEKTAPWRDVNDEVARVGGHLGIFRNQATGAAPAAAGHAGHHPGAPK
jgi:hypothetical protein